jgi:uncharacterized Zn-finger protein
LAEIKLQKKKKVLDKYDGGEYLDGSGGLTNAIEENSDSQGLNDNSGSKTLEPPPSKSRLYG